MPLKMDQKKPSRVSKVKVLMKSIFVTFLDMNFVQSQHQGSKTQYQRDGNKMVCEFYGDEEGHSIEECIEFKQLLQKLMDEQLIQIGYNDEENNLNAIEGSDKVNNIQTSPFSPNTLVIAIIRTHLHHFLKHSLLESWNLLEFKYLCLSLIRRLMRRHGTIIVKFFRTATIIPL